MSVETDKIGFVYNIDKFDPTNIKEALGLNLDDDGRTKKLKVLVRRFGIDELLRLANILYRNNKLSEDEMRKIGLTTIFTTE